ncbi:MAG: hypothetical protein AB1481_02150 [Candidatus Omnitrophota bacterium]
MMQAFKRNRVKIIILGTAFLIFSLKDSFAVPSQFQEMERLQKGEQQSNTEGDLGLVNKPSVIYDAETLRDPFEQRFVREENEKDGKITIQPSQPLPQLTVQGVIWGSSRPQAIINGNVVNIGDTVDGAHIINIDKQGVTVLYGSQKHTFATQGLGIHVSP